MAEQVKERPEGLTDEMLEWLDDLRAGGSINMWGAAIPLAKKFGIYHEYRPGSWRPDKRKAKMYLMYWIQTFGAESR